MTAPADAALCLAVGCTRPQDGAGRLCRADAARLGDWIAQIGQEYDRLDAVPSMQGREVGTIGGATLAGQRNPGRLDVIVLRDGRSRERDEQDPDGTSGRGVLEVLGSWAATVREGRGLQGPTRQLVIRLRPERNPGPLCSAYARLTQPCTHGSCRAGVVLHTVPVAPTVASERALLARHLDWAVTQDWAGELFAEVRAVWGLLRSANGHGPGARTRLYEAPCSECDVRAVCYRQGDSGPRCRNCGATAQAAELVEAVA